MRILAFVGGVLIACGGGGSGRPPGDQWFQSVAAGESGTGSRFTGALELVLYTPEYADRRQPGTIGSDPNKQEVGGVLSIPGGAPIQIKGTWTGNSYTASGGGFTFTGTVDGRSTEGTFTGPNGTEGDFAGEDATDQMTASFCGSYSGSGSGTWNFVVAESGSVSGAFAGTAGGTLDGSVSGASISLRWSGDAGGDAANGTADGTISGSTVSGSWEGEVDGVFGGSVSGTWQSDASCPGGDGPAQEMDASCPCDRSPLPAGGACCKGGPFGEFCCSSSH